MLTHPLNFPEIYTQVPHAGTMRLIDSVVAWDECSIVCSSRSHRQSSNPLRRDGHLACVHAVEYAAQAMIIHAWLRSASSDADPETTPPKAVYIASMRDVALTGGSLDQGDDEKLEISAVLNGEVGGVCNYRFAVTGATTTFATGQVVVLARGEA
jgi:predicted hotdog family 3-hydroxylacyl-ACP dehydratase